MSVYFHQKNRWFSGKDKCKVSKEGYLKTPSQKQRIGLASCRTLSSYDCELHPYAVRSTTLGLCYITKIPWESLAGFYARRCVLTSALLAGLGQVSDIHLLGPPLFVCPQGQQRLGFGVQQGLRGPIVEMVDCVFRRVSWAAWCSCWRSLTVNPSLATGGSHKAGVSQDTFISSIRYSCWCCVDLYFLFKSDGLHLGQERSWEGRYLCGRVLKRGRRHADAR